MKLSSTPRGVYIDLVNKGIIVDSKVFDLTRLNATVRSNSG